uniref:Tc1-like transposase DDE domain-containing protein n=1 Tax=Oncorhynchus tshawytscha TaxID=74940 RepID=A0AAZ3RBZ6_ONCTS
MTDVTESGDAVENVLLPATSTSMTGLAVGQSWCGGGISLGGLTALHVLTRGSLTAIRYRYEILRPLGRPYAGAVGPGFLLMQDNARPHMAGVCQQFLQEEGIDAMDWPARSPDLNPIEHIWDIMSRSIHQCHVAPQTVQELADALVQVWEEIPQETIRHLIRSMPRHCREVIQARGGHTHY